MSYTNHNMQQIRPLSGSSQFRDHPDVNPDLNNFYDPTSLPVSHPLNSTLVFILGLRLGYSCRDPFTARHLAAASAASTALARPSFTLPFTDTTSLFLSLFIIPLTFYSRFRPHIVSRATTLLTPPASTSTTPSPHPATPSANRRPTSLKTPLVEAHTLL
jgi:hypothetical protein